MTSLLAVRSAQIGMAAPDVTGSLSILNVDVNSEVYRCQPPTPGKHSLQPLPVLPVVTAEERADEAGLRGADDQRAVVEDLHGRGLLLGGTDRLPHRTIGPRLRRRTVPPDHS